MLIVVVLVVMAIYAATRLSLRAWLVWLAFTLMAAWLIVGHP